MNSITIETNNTTIGGTAAKHRINLNMKKLLVGLIFAFCLAVPIASQAQVVVVVHPHHHHHHYHHRHY
jgi:hypothetical protein